MVKNLYLDINIVPCEIIREEDGLALSSRNVYLSKEQREKALLISKSLKLAAKSIGIGELQSIILKDNIKTTLSESSGIELDYIEIVDRKFNQIHTIELKNSIILIAVKIGNTRLIDNIWI